MKPEVKSLVAVCGYISFVILTIFFLRLDFSSPYPLANDMVYRFSLFSWIYFLCITVAILIMYQIFDSHFRWVIPFLLASVFVVAFPLAQYPTVQNSDTFMHAGASRYLADYGYIHSVTTYSKYPGSFMLAAVLSKMLGLPVLETSILLSSFVNFSIVFLLYIVGGLAVGRRWSWLVPTSYLAISFRHYTSLLHYSPQLLGFCLYITFLAVLFKILKSPKVRKWKVILVILLSFLSMTHPFSGAFVISALMGIYLAGGKIRSPWQLTKRIHLTLATIALLLLGVTFFVSWHTFVAVEVLKTTIEFVPSFLRGAEKLANIKDVMYGPPPGLLGTVLQLYRLGIYILFMFLGAVGLVLFRHKMEVKLILGLIVGNLIGAIFIFLTPATIYGVGRIVIYGGVLISILPSYLLANGSIKRLGKTLKVLNGVIPILVLVTFLVSNMYSSSYISFVHPEDTSVSNFVAQRVDEAVVAPVTEAMILFYVRERLGGNFFLDVVRNDAVPDIASQRFENGSLSLQDFPRQSYYFSFGFVENRSNLIYSNGLHRVYTKMNASSPQP